MGSTDSSENLFTSAIYEDLESISSGCLGYELKSPRPAAEVELNKESLQLQEPKPTVPRKSVRSVSQVRISEGSLGDMVENCNINDARKKRSTDAFSGNKQASRGEAENNIASGEKGKQDTDIPRFKPKLSCVSSSEPVCGNSGCLGYELKSPRPTEEVECNKENLQLQEPKPAMPRKFVRSLSQVGVSEGSLGDMVENCDNIDARKKRLTSAFSGNKKASPGDGENNIASGEKGKQDTYIPRFKGKLSCLSSSQPVFGNRSVSEGSLGDMVENCNNNDARKKRLTSAFSGNKKASPGDGENNIASGEKGKQDTHIPRFKRKLSCLSSSQPVFGNRIDSGKTINWEIEYKKQVQTVKKMQLRGDRAKEKLKLLKIELKKMNDIIMN